MDAVAQKLKITFFLQTTGVAEGDEDSIDQLDFELLAKK